MLDILTTSNTSPYVGVEFMRHVIKTKLPSFHHRYIWHSHSIPRWPWKRWLRPYCQMYPFQHQQVSGQWHGIHTVNRLNIFLNWSWQVLAHKKFIVPRDGLQLLCHTEPILIYDGLRCLTPIDPGTHCCGSQTMPGMHGNYVFILIIQNHFVTDTNDSSQ